MSFQKLEGDYRNFCFCHLIHKNGFQKLDALIINLYFFQVFIQYGRVIQTIKKGILKMLSHEPARQLKSREIAKLTAAFFGGIMEQCEKGGLTIIEVLEHFKEHHEKYKSHFLELDELLNNEIRKHQKQN